MKTSISMSDIISRLEKLDEQYNNQSSSTASSTINNTTDSEYSSAYSSVSGSRPSTPPPATQIPLNVLNIEEGVCRALPCKTWISTGTCPYNKRCQFSHDPRVETLYAFTLKTRRKQQEESTIDALFWPPIPRANLYYDRRRNEPITNQQYLIPHPMNSPYLVRVGGVTAFLSKIQAESIYSMYNYFIDFLNKDAAHAYEKMYSIPQNEYMMYDNPYSNSSSQAYTNNSIDSYITPQHQDYNNINEYDNHDQCHYDFNGNKCVEYNSEDDCRHYNEHTGKRRLNVFIELSEGKSL